MTDNAAAYGASAVKRVRRTNAQLDTLDDAILAAVAADHPVSLRGVYYRCVSAGAVPKTEAAYRAVGRRLLALRRTGRLPYNRITDGTRWVNRPTTYRDVGDALTWWAYSYRRELWRNQGVAVFVFAEKDAISGVLGPITRRWDVSLGVLRGFASETFLHEMAADIHSEDRPSYVYQLGDHDPSGVAAWEHFQDKVSGFLPAGFPVTFERLAVTPAQIDEWGLPTRPTKRGDTRARNFVGESVEVDAIPAQRLRDLLEDAIRQHIDQHALDVTLAAEASEKDGLRRMRGAL